MSMTIPFLNFLKKVKDQTLTKKEVPAAPPTVAKPLEKPTSERLSKTVMPNATRSLSPQDPFEMAARAPAPVGQLAAKAGAASSGARTIAIGATAPVARPKDFPPAVALALEPAVERVISLDLADIANQIPPDYIKPIESIDGTRRILLKASEVEKGMASRKPSVLLATIYEQVPEIFLRSIVPSDQILVHLPFQKVLEQFASLQVRSDQERYQAVPQVETPFLQATLEDNTRFGTTTEPVETGDMPPVRVEPPTAEAFAAAEPEAAESAVKPDPAANGAVEPETEETPAKPKRVAFKLSPNGTDGSAPESVPASSGPSVPTSLQPKPAPTRIPFKIPTSGEDLPSKHEPCSIPEIPKRKTPPAEDPVLPPAAGAPDVKITLALKPILRGVPPSQLKGDASSIPADAKIELPFSLIESQLATGRVAVTASALAAELPPEYRDLFKVDNPAEVILPLQEVMKNLPAASLRTRTDQEEQETGVGFATPFSAKAEEDAKRFGVSGKIAPAPKTTPAAPPPAAKEEPAVKEAPVKDVFGKKTAKKAPAKEASAKAAPAKDVPVKKPPVVSTAPAVKPVETQSRTPLQAVFETDEILDDKAVVAHVNKLSGVKGCALMFGDGLSLAGSLPPEYGTEGLCAMAPSLMQRIEKHMVETKLGPLRGMTLSCTKSSVTFFMHDNLCLAALHANAELTSEVQEKLARVVHELSQKYSQAV